MPEIKNRVQLPKLDRPSYPFLPSDVDYSEKERTIYYEVTKNVPNKEFSVVAEMATSQIAREELHVIGLDVKHLTLATFYKRTIATMDAYFDLHRSEFGGVISNDKSLLSSLLEIKVHPSDKYSGLEFKIGDLLIILQKTFRSSELYSVNSQSLLQNTFQSLITTASKALSREGINPTALTINDVERIKSETNLPHARMMFDIILASYFDHPNYQVAKTRFESTKMAYQIKNDIVGICEDYKHNNANFYIAGAGEYGELPNLVESLSYMGRALLKSESVFDYYDIVADTLPQTYSHWERRQEKLLANAKLVENINCVVSIT